MVNIIKSVASWAAHRDSVWSMLEGTVVKFSQFAVRERRRLETSRNSSYFQQDAEEKVPAERPYEGCEAFLKQTFPSLTVAHGPFTGLRYPKGKAYGSAVVPKLLGSYERELHGLLDRIIATPYAHVIDIGCAEGYYANGLALRMPQTHVHAYDINPKATAFCQAMAELNGQSQRISVGAFCSSETLISFHYKGRSLILADCEGYEKSLFPPAACAALATHDVLIEVHDFIDIDISTRLRKHFAATHDLQVFESIDDIKKAHAYGYAELDGFDLEARRQLVGEFRPAIMEWFFFTPKARA